VPPIEAIGPGSRAVRCFEWRRTPPLPEFRRREATPPADAGTLLLVESLSALYHGQGEAVVAASDVSFGVGAGECVALIGESGSGKTTIARCIAGLHPPESGRLMLGGELLAALAQRRTRVQRQRIQIVFQNPYDSLNPRHRIGDTIGRPARVLRGIGRAEAARLVDDLLARVRLPLRVAQCFPRELSGGERQRVALARALAAGPDLLVCDEITSALDVSVQAAVLELLSELRTDLGVSLLVITHDLGVVASVAERVIVLERGRICEEAPVESLLTSPEHEYTRRLIEAAPELPDPVADGES
jgi:peptide/nickel transport system ATP-binding protein